MVWMEPQIEETTDRLIQIGSTGSLPEAAATFSSNTMTANLWWNSQGSARVSQALDRFHINELQLLGF